MLKIFNFLEALSWKTLWLRFLLIKNMLRITGKYTSYIYALAWANFYHLLFIISQKVD